MVLEDEPIVALDLDEMLSDAGYEVYPVISSCAVALEWLRVNTPDLAIIDVELRDGPCQEIAKMLHAKSIPFMVFSGSSPRDNIDAAFKLGQWLDKPAAAFAVVSALEALAAGYSTLDNLGRL